MASHFAGDSAQFLIPRRTFMTISRIFLAIALIFAIFGISSAPARAQSSDEIALGAYYYLGNGMNAPGDMAAVNAWRSQVGRLPAVWSIYQSWTGWNQFPIAQAQSAQKLGGRLMVTWEPWSGAIGDANWSCRRVAQGDYDPYIRQYARAVRQCGVPVMIRLAHEMNGDWYPWGTAYVTSDARRNGNSPADYVLMWQRVVRIFRVEGARNASWIWAPNLIYQTPFNSYERQRADLQDLYPGDEWVDWIGLSIYNDGARRPWRSFAQLFDGSYQIVASLANKPMMIAELGVTEQGAPRGQSKAQWIADTFLQEIPRRYPRVKLVNYFFRDKTNQGESNFRFDSSPDALKAFRSVVASPLYAGNVTDTPSRQDFPTTVASAKIIARPQQPIDAPDDAPETVMSGNNGVVRNDSGDRQAMLPQLRLQR